MTYILKRLVVQGSDNYHITLVNLRCVIAGSLDVGLSLLPEASTLFSNYSLKVGWG